LPLWAPTNRQIFCFFATLGNNRHCNMMWQLSSQAGMMQPCDCYSAKEWQEQGCGVAGVGVWPLAAAATAATGWPLQWLHPVLLVVVPPSGASTIWGMGSMAP